MTAHNDTVCSKYHEPVLPDEKGYCSLCGATLLQQRQEFFVVTRLSRQDLETRLEEKEIAKLTDEDMAWIASKMGEAYCESGAFWDDAEYYARNILDEWEL